MSLESSPLNSPFVPRDPAQSIAHWLQTHYQEVPKNQNHVARALIYGQYTQHFSSRQLKFENQARFGKILHSLFPNVTTRRLGNRGMSKYHYCGLRVRPEVTIPPLIPVEPQPDMLGPAGPPATSVLDLSAEPATALLPFAGVKRRRPSVGSDARNEPVASREKKFAFQRFDHQRRAHDSDSVEELRLAAVESYAGSDSEADDWAAGGSSDSEIDDVDEPTHTSSAASTTPQEPPVFYASPRQTMLRIDQLCVDNEADVKPRPLPSLVPPPRRPPVAAPIPDDAGFSAAEVFESLTRQLPQLSSRLRFITERNVHGRRFQLLDDGMLLHYGLDDPLDRAEVLAMKSKAAASPLKSTATQPLKAAATQPLKTAAPPLKAAATPSSSASGAMPKDDVPSLFAQAEGGALRAQVKRPEPPVLDITKPASFDVGPSPVAFLFKAQQDGATPDATELAQRAAAFAAFKAEWDEKLDGKAAQKPKPKPVQPKSTIELLLESQNVTNGCRHRIRRTNMTEDEWVTRSKLNTVDQKKLQELIAAREKAAAAAAATRALRTKPVESTTSRTASAPNADDTEQDHAAEIMMRLYRP
eukprot:TRINITY_DN5276_c0_g1_i1.p1 TRINITY_DN5276_c0_g1~~TRINITY_DN5276_c0_g1_i1.p1  ORF type:complete len:586 (+),score=117.48 TRINITY_DN5276_c0_g1_i1:263-2020(+)